ncbi:hypothetical protein IT417_03085 [bacterium]|nr:hypothetical protein [bacterium]
MAKPSVNFLRSENLEFNTGIDLNRELVNHPLSTFFLRVADEIPGEDSIIRGDVLVVDRSEVLVEGKNLVYSDGDRLLWGQVIKKVDGFWIRRGEQYFKLNEETEVWGNITYIIRKV